MFFVGQVSGLVENLNIEIYSDTINVVNVRLYMMVIQIGLYLFIPLSVFLIIFQSHSDVKQFKLKMFSAYQINLKHSRIARCVKCIMNIPPFFFTKKKKKILLHIFKVMDRSFRQSQASNTWAQL